MRRGSGFHDKRSPLRFDPATLFIGGAIKGAFYDSSNISALFQDDAGATPVTAVEQTVGRILDLSGNGNHATQSTAALRPTYRSRYNLLTYSEQFNNAAWGRFDSSIVVDATTAPNGATTADKFREGTGSSIHRIIQGTTIAAGSGYTASVYAKASERTRVMLRTNNGSADADTVFDLSNGSIVSGVGTIENVGSGWYRIARTFTAATSTTSSFIFQLLLVDTGTNIAYTGDGASGIFLWGGQLLSANDVTTTGNAYQRVAAATSYDTSSPVWRPYLALDGSDDSMLTGSIDFTGTDKMTVWAGVTKSSDAAQGVVAELSATIASNNGAFLLSAPNSAAANYNWSSKGTTQVDNTVTTYAAPNTAVLTGQANIAGPSNIIRVNGAQAGSVATTQGTGNFGNYPLFIGRRNNATLPFNGRLYGLIVLGAAASDWQVYVTEQWMAGKTGLQF